MERLDLRGYARTLRLGDARGWLGVSAADDRPALELTSDSLRHASQPLVARVRKMFDPDADPQVIAAHFAGDPALGPLVSAQPGLRLPAAYDPFEQAVRAVVGQQVTVKAAVTITRRPVERLGEPLAQAPTGLEVLFPTAQAIADDPLENIGMPAKRAQALRRLAGAVAEARCTCMWRMAPIRWSVGCASCPASAPGRPNTSRCAVLAWQTPSQCRSGFTQGAALGSGWPDRQGAGRTCRSLAPMAGLRSHPHLG